MVKTDIARNVEDEGWFMKPLVWVYLSFSGKSPDHGARLYVKAALRPKEEHVSKEGLFYIMVENMQRGHANPRVRGNSRSHG